ncbi:hypothetical protein GOODEAATRI_033584 [Goodea atripinnis]|uniref:Uncharacterized protein n=1 Tax=Goodea atripinnis TaxID=208336 RepID=A0ABV0Q3M9_9TELE
MAIGPAFGTFGSVARYQVLLENKISISIQLVSRRKHEVLYNVLVDGCVDWTSENLVDQNQMTWHPKSLLNVETSHWTSSNVDSVPLQSSSRLCNLDLQMKSNLYFHLKTGLWTPEQQLKKNYSFDPFRPRWTGMDRTESHGSG